MGSSPTISQQKILEAAGGNSALQEVLQQMAQVASQQQSATGTTPGASGPQAAVNSSAKVPPQATGSVSVLAGIYTVQIVNPGAISPLSQLQAAQNAQNATSLTALQPITAIYHQIRASTSPGFNVNSNTQTFGGDTGNTQTLWTINGLGSGTWYFQFRSSYDGVNWNTWKNANSGTAFGGLVGQVTLQSESYSDWALFSLPGSEIMGVLDGYAPDQGVIGIPSGYNLYSSGLIAIAGPNGFFPQGNAVYGVTACDVDLEVPQGGGGASGIPDWPVQIAMRYGVSASPATSPGYADVFGVAFNPEGSNVTLYEGPNSAVWVVFTLPGGCPVAFGQGQNADGDTIWMPPGVAWMSSANMMSICSLTKATNTAYTVSGYYSNQITAGVLAARFINSDSTQIPVSANWFAIAWPTGANVSTVGTTTFIEFALQGGHKVAFGAGQVASETGMTLPVGYVSNQLISICTPASTATVGNHMRGVQQCSMLGLTPILFYTDNSQTWTGNVNYMVFAWK